MTSANAIDLAIFGVIILSIITGLVRGFVKELVALSVWVLAIWIAYHYSPSVEPLLNAYIKDATVRTVCAFIILLLVTVIAGGIANTLLGIIMKRSGLSGTDRLLGMGFGFVRGVFIVALVMAVIKMTSLPYKDYAEKSQLYAQFTPVVNWMYGYMPEFLKQAKAIAPKESGLDFKALSLK